MIVKEVDKTFTIYNIRDYNNLIKLLEEHKLDLKAVKTKTITTEKGDKEVVVITACGDLNYLEFVKYLLEKKQKETAKLLGKLRIEGMRK